MTPSKKIVLVQGLWAVGAGVAVLAQAPSALRVPLALGLVLVLPGSALTHLLFARGTLAPEVHLLLAVGISMGISATLGIALHFLPWGIQSGTWIGLLLGVTVPALAAAFWADRSAPCAAMGEGSRVRPRDAVLGTLGVLTALAAVAVAARDANEQTDVGFSQLWLRPAGTAQIEALEIGLRSEERGTVSYRVVVTGVDGSLATWDVPDVAPGETWAQTLPLTGEVAHGGPIRAELYRTAEPTVVYRHVEIWPSTLREYTTP